MKRKFISFILIPHHKGKQKTLTFSKKRFRLILGMVGLIAAVFLAFMVDYFTMNVTRSKYKQLCEEIQEKKETIAQYKTKVKKLKETTDQFANYAQKLNVMAGLKSTETLKEVGIGGGSSSEQEISSMDSSQNVNLNRLNKIERKAEGIEKNLDTLLDFYKDQALKLAGTPTIWPTKGWMTSAYGWRKDPFTGKRSFHRGIDVATHFGNPVVATADGVVIKTSYGKIGGKTVKINHQGGYTTVYCHLSKFKVKTGEKVKRGDVIGVVGKTGKALGPHVHYEVRLKGKSKNPYYYILEE
ncbi:peptidoglycan DD-metalloendopeptidase family protein [bacterium]|nr:peptidoglycan DD-metalloendopeptidase family protein [bacterium]